MSATRERLLLRATGSAVRSSSPLSGGVFGAVRLVRLADGAELIAKFAPFERLEEEAAGLEALRATDTVRVPVVRSVTAGEAGETAAEGVLLMESLPVGGTPDWDRFGRELAALHRTPAGDRYGFDRDNHLGSTPQDNRWCGDWVRFNREQRHGPLLDRLRRGGGLEGADARLVERTLEAFEDVLPNRPRPGLIHGDLWSGNALPLLDGRVAVIDPAPSVGDGTADLAMMQLFGGFPERCFESYRTELGLDPDPRALAVHRLYHLLNHMVLFGAGYRPAALETCRVVLGSAD